MDVLGRLYGGGAGWARWAEVAALARLLCSRDAARRLYAAAAPAVGAFEPLGGHEDIWAFSPRLPPPRALVKRCLPGEALFYTHTLHVALDGRPDAKFAPACAAVAFAEWPATTEAAQRWARELLRFTPRVFSVVHASAHDPSGYVEMENVSWPLRAAGVYGEMDLKLGTCLYGLDATDAKREKMTLKAQRTTSGRTGLCIIAYRANDGARELALSRPESRAITAEHEMRRHLRLFLRCAGASVVARLLALVARLLAFFEEQTLVHINGSSLLIAFRPNDPASVQLKLIDFAHASFFHAAPDTSTLSGLRYLLRVLDEHLAGE